MPEVIEGRLELHGTGFSVAQYPAEKGREKPTRDEGARGGRTNKTNLLKHAVTEGCSGRFSKLERSARLMSTFPISSSLPNKLLLYTTPLSLARPSQLSMSTSLNTGLQLLPTLLLFKLCLPRVNRA